MKENSLNIFAIGNVHHQNVWTNNTKTLLCLILINAHFFKKRKKNRYMFLCLTDNNEALIITKKY